MHVPNSSRSVELKGEIKHHGDGGHARAMSCDVNRRIIEDDGALPYLAWASQNFTAVATLLRGLPEPTRFEDHQAHREIRTLLERAAVQQAESSLFRLCELDASQCAPSR